MPINTEPFNIEVLILALTHGPSSIGIIQKPESLAGKKALVPFGVPGELVLSRVLQEKKKIIFAESPHEILKKSEFRVPPKCPYFQSCGGCDHQNMQDAFQRLQKLEVVKGSIEKHAQMIPKSGYEIRGSHLPYWNYRNRIKLQISPEGSYGFYRKNSHEIVEIVECKIAAPALNLELAQLRKEHPRLPPEFSALHLQLNDQDTVECHLETRNSKKLTKHRELAANLGNHFTLSQSGFSQVNTAGNNLLVDIVIQKFQNESILELFAGSGNFSLPLSLNRECSVTAIESASELVQAARESIEINQLQGRLDFHLLKVENYQYPKRFDSLLLDPPRTGAKEFLQRISREDFKKIVYVSCDQATLCRDLKILAEKGYSLESVEVIDLFPQTYHVEVVATLLA